MNDSDYEKFYRIGNVDKKVQLESKYGVCFRVCLNFLAQMLRNRFGDREVSLHVVVESGHANSGAIPTIFNEFKKYAEKIYAANLKSVMLVDKRDCCGVQAADFLAYYSCAYERNGADVESVPFSFVPCSWDHVEKSDRKSRRQYRLICAPELLSELRQHRIDGAAARKTHWESRRTIGELPSPGAN